MKVKISSGNIVTEEEINKLAYQLILNNIDQPLSFHLFNLKNNKINWKKIKIRNLLQGIKISKR